MNDLRAAQEAVEKATTPAELHALLFKWEGRAGHVIDSIALHGRVWDDALVYIILTHGAGAILDLFKNPHRPENFEALATQWAMARLASESAKEEFERAELVLSRLATNGHLPIQGPTVQKLFEMLKPKRKSAKMTQRQQTIFTILRNHPETGSDELSRLYDLAVAYSDHAEAVARILSHSNAPPSLWRRIILEDEHETLPGPILDACCSRAEIRQDPLVRGKLLETIFRANLTSRLADFVADLNPKDCAELFRKLVQSNSWRVDATLLQYGREIAPYLNVEDFQPFLSSPKQEVRLAAIACLGYVQGGPKEDLDTPTRTL